MLRSYALAFLFVLVAATAVDRRADAYEVETHEAITPIDSDVTCLARPGVLRASSR